MSKYEQMAIHINKMIMIKQ